MRIISKHIEAPGQNELLQDISSLSDLIFLDIETTGLSSEHCSVYLIGCIYYQPKKKFSPPSCSLRPDTNS